MQQAIPQRVQVGASASRVANQCGVKKQDSCLSLADNAFDALEQIGRECKSCPPLFIKEIPPRFSTSSRIQPRPHSYQDFCAGVLLVGGRYGVNISCNPPPQ